MNSILDDFKQAFRTGNILNQLIVINVVVFVAFGLLRVFIGFSGSEASFYEFQSYFTLPSNVEKLIYKPWTIVTHMFMHAGIRHILWNMLFMYWFGRIITEYLGQNKLLGLYVWGGLAGGVAFILSYNLIPLFSDVVGVAFALGASGAVNAIVVGAATFQPNYGVRMLFLGTIRLKYIAAFFVLSAALNLTGSNAGGEFAHLGGAFMGYWVMTQLQKGTDWSRPVVQFITWVKSFFVRQPRMNVSYTKKEKKSRRASSKSRAGSASTAKKTTPQAEIDAILDKISEKGYDALSKEEKQKLFNASKD